MYCNVSSTHSDALNYNHVHHERRLPSMLATCRCNRSYLHFTALHQLNEVSKENVPVPLTETLRVVGHLQERRKRGFLTSQNCLRAGELSKMKDDPWVEIKSLTNILT